MNSFYVKIYHNFKFLYHCVLGVPENKTSSIEIAHLKFPKLVPVFLDYALKILFVQPMGSYFVLVFCKKTFSFLFGTVKLKKFEQTFVSHVSINLNKTAFLMIIWTL